MSGRGRAYRHSRPVLGTPQPLGFDALTIKDDEVWEEYKDYVPPAQPQLQPQGLVKVNGEGAWSETSGTWDRFMYKEAGVNPVGDKMFQSFLNRQNVFGTCKHKETVRSDGRCSCAKRTPLNLCLDCTTVLPCCIQARPGPSSSSRP